MAHKKKPHTKKVEKKKVKRSKHGKILAEWVFPEYEVHERGVQWFIGAGVIASAAVIWSIMISNYLFALIIIMIAVIILTHHYNTPHDVEFQITDDGLQLGDHFYDYAGIEKFWIIYDPPGVKKIYFEFKSFLHPRLSIPLLENNPLVIRGILLKLLEEDLEEEYESFSEVLGRRWKL